MVNMAAPAMPTIAATYGSMLLHMAQTEIMPVSAPSMVMRSDQVPDRPCRTRNRIRVTAPPKEPLMMVDITDLEVKI